MRILFMMLLLSGLWSCATKERQPVQTQPTTEVQDTVANTSSDTLNEKQDTTTPPSPFEGFKWKLHSMEEGGKTVLPNKDSEMTVVFNNGKLSGSGGCNQYNGTYTASTSGEIKISDLAQTKRICSGLMGQESLFLSLLTGTTSWKMDRVELKLQSAAGTMVFFNNIPEEKK